MNNESSSAISIGSGFSSLLTVAFIVLKLCKVISWKWIWVLAPLWIDLGLAILITIIVIIVTILRDR